MNGYLRAMRNYASFNGRASRAEFWQFTLILSVIGFVALIIDAAYISGPAGKETPFTALVFLAHALPSLAVAVRRLHDVDRNGWFVLVGAIPLVGFVLMLVWACEAGTRGPNQFGPSPLDGLPAPMGQPVPVNTAMAGPPLAATPAAGSRDVVGELERLATLHSQGRLSDAEFATLKARALAAGDPA